MGSGIFSMLVRNLRRGIVVACHLLLVPSNVIANPAPGAWALEETFDGDPESPSQALLPPDFDFVVTHRTHPQEQFTKAYAPFPADHDLTCRGPNPAFDPLPRHDVFTSQTSDGENPDESFFVCRNHMMSSMGEVGAYSNSVFWPMQEFDFAGGGTLEFDVNINEGFSQRHWWEVLIAPREQLRFSPAPVGSAVDETYPADRIVFDFRENVRQIRVGEGAIAPDGWAVEERQFAAYDFAYWRVLHPNDPALDDRRIRRTMRIRIEPDRISWGIETENGGFDTFEVEVPGGLPFSRGLVQFKTHSYTPSKQDNFDTFTYHWDDIRFDGPVVGTYEAHRADDVVYLQANGHRPIGDTQSVTLSIPEVGPEPILLGQLNGALKDQATLRINGGPDLVVNLDAYPIADCVSGQWQDWGSFRLPLDPAWLEPGDNTFTWTVGPRPACAVPHPEWWDGYSVKSLQVQLPTPLPEPQGAPPLVAALAALWGLAGKRRCRRAPRPLDAGPRRSDKT